MRLRHSPLAGSIALALSVACGGDSPAGPDGRLAVGQSLTVSGARMLTLEPGVSAGEYYAVVANTSIRATGSETFSMRGEGITSATASLAPDDGTLSSTRSAAASGSTELVIDRAWESGVRARERADLTPRIAAARAAYVARSSVSAGADPSEALSPTARRAGLIPSTAKVGDTVRVNVNLDVSCSSPIYRMALVTAMGARSIVLSDLDNPPGGFAEADFQRFAARFDTLIYPLIVANYGAPTDIDNNGKVALLFTVAINQQTPSGSTAYTSGITYSRDLFPVIGTPRAKACAASNESELLYLLAPDPLGTINGNRRTKAFVDSNTTAVIAHELEHLINQGRRLYVNNAPVFESTWLDEALAHVAEEILFFRESGLGPRQNLGGPEVRSTPQRLAAFNQDMIGNVDRYRQYLQAPSSSSPYSMNDDLPTRGAGYSFLRYLIDKTSTNDATVLSRLVNSLDSGTTNVRAVFGGELSAHVRDWSVSNAVDDLGPPDRAFLQPSWNWRSIYSALRGSYPLRVQRLVNGAGVNAGAVPGGAAYYVLSVAAGASATITLGGQPESSTNLELVIVRTR